MKTSTQSIEQQKQNLLAKIKLLEENETRVKDILEKVLPKARAEILTALDSLGEFSADDYSTSYVEIIKGYGADGVLLSRLRLVLPEAEKLSKVRTHFGPDGEGTIKEEKENMTIRLYYVDQPTTPAAQVLLPAGQTA